jgi:predicted MFS family arabinose efflux permease
MTTALTTATKPKSSQVKGATMALCLLTALNLVNYIDRYILPGVQEQIKGEFHLSDAQVGRLMLWFFVAYMAASPVTGWLGDRFPRKPMIIAAALFWSGANLFTASVHSYSSLNFRHAALGIGEASFGIFAPAMIADFYRPDQRNRVMTVFNVAIPFGAALGYLVGGVIGSRYGWRHAFLFSAIPGIVIAVLMIFLMHEPERKEQEKPKLALSAVVDLGGNKAYLCSILGYAMVTFSLGGLSWWIPSFLQRATGRSESDAAFVMGAITVACGISGTILGGVIAQKWQKTNKGALYLVPAISALLALPPALLCFFGPPSMTVPGLAAAVFFVFLGTGPVNAATLNAVPASVRATAMAGQLLIIHLLGDAISPSIIGVVSDHSNLRLGLGVTLITFVLAAIIFFIGARFAPPLNDSLEGAAA